MSPFSVGGPAGPVRPSTENGLIGVGKASAENGVGKVFMENGVGKASMENGVNGVGKASTEKGVNGFGKASAENGVGKVFMENGVGKASMENNVNGVGKASTEKGVNGFGKASTENGVNGDGIASTKVCLNGYRICANGGDLPLALSASCSTLIKGLGLAEDEWRWLQRCLEAAGKGFSIGAGIKGGLALFSILVRLRSRKSKGAHARKPGAITNAVAIRSAAKETLRYGMFLGTFAGTFVSVDELIAKIWGHQRTAGWRALLAGALAGPSMLLTGLEAQHTSLAMYILIRATVLASRCGIKSKRFGSFCKPLTWSHGDIFLMCLSSSQILSAYILKQESLPSSYKAFLNKHGGKAAIILQGIKEIASNTPFTSLDVIEKHYKSMGVDLKLDPSMKVPCSIIHGNQSCTSHFISFLIQEYRRALPVYLPVYLIPALIVHRQGLVKRPYTILAKTLLGTAKSSLFLSAYCASAWAWTCLLFRTFNRCNIPLVAAGTFLTGAALTIEKKSRRIEISLYCLARAIESFFTCVSDAGFLPHVSRLKRADVVVFSIATSIIMHCYAQEREVFRSKYLNVLDWVFGVPPHFSEEDELNDKSKKQ